MSLYSRFCAWLSGWPETSKFGRDDHEEDYLFEEEEKKIRENNSNIGKKQKKLKKDTK
jgi:hypothetical protein